MKDETGELFESEDREEGRERRPLAERMRPRSLEEVVGQEHLLGPGKVLREAVERGKLFSLLFWGPPGCGKTALARVLTKGTGSHWATFSAVLSGVKEIREVLRESGYQWSRNRKQTVLFVDEIHRFNTAQQDAFLPHVEDGGILLMGATTENPSFEINKALLSRTEVLVLNPLSPSEMARIVQRALEDRERGLGGLELTIDSEALEVLCKASQGDARRGLNALEVATTLLQNQRPADRILRVEDVREALQSRTLYYDKDGEEHYNLISAFIKSLRGSDPDAALYWMARMLAGGEDPLFLARRMVIFASEDIGNADPNALTLAVSVKEAVHFVGLPEAALNLSQAVTYLATAPKSNASYRALSEAQRAAREHGILPVPLSLRNAPTGLMRNLGYGRDYEYPHDDPHAIVQAEYLPDELAGTVFYRPTDRGYEKTIRDRLTRWREIRRGKAKKRRGGSQEPVT
jgi:putative ATPase